MSRTLGKKESGITPSIPPEAKARTSLEEECGKSEMESYNASLETFPSPYLHCCCFILNVPSSIPPLNKIIYSDRDNTHRMF